MVGVMFKIMFSHDGVLLPVDGQKCTKRMALGTKVDAPMAYVRTELKSLYKPSLANQTTWKHALKVTLGEGLSKKDLESFEIESDQGSSPTCFTKNFAASSSKYH